MPWLIDWNQPAVNYYDKSMEFFLGDDWLLIVVFKGLTSLIFRLGWIMHVCAVGLITYQPC